MTSKQQKKHDKKVKIDEKQKAKWKNKINKDSLLLQKFSSVTKKKKEVNTKIAISYLR